MVEGLALTEVPGGTRMRLRVKAGAKADRILGVYGEALKLSVTTAPEKGKANKAVLGLLGRVLDLAPSTIELVSGHTGQDKIVEIPLSAEEIADRLSRT